jgi:hypothetical protein
MVHFLRRLELAGTSSVTGSTLESFCDRTTAHVASRVRAPLRAETWLFLLFWLLLLVAGRERLFQDPGTFWHTATGQQMLEGGELVRHDRLTFTFAGQPWIAHQWLAECLMAAVYRLAGWDGLLVSTAALMAALWSWIGSRLLRLGLSGWAAAIVLAIVFLGSAHHLHVRPHLASMVGMALMFGLLCDVEMGRRKVAALGWLVPLFAVWTNLHGGALGGLATMTIVITGWMIYAALRLTTPLKRPRDFAWAAAAVFGCLAAILLNPYGWQMLQTWLLIMHMSLPGMIVEHGRPNPLHIETWMLALAACGSVALLATSLPRRFWQSAAGMLQAARGTRCTWLVLLVWLALACDRVRHVPLFVLLVAVALPDLVSSSRCKWWFIRRGWFAPPSANVATDGTMAAWKAPAVLVAALLLLSNWGTGTQWARFDRARWPVEMMDDLKAIQHTSAEDRRIFNTLDFGGFVAFHAPQLRTLIDDRCELFGDRFLREYYEAETSRPERIDRWHEQYHFQHALVRTGSPFDRYLSQHADWRRVRRTPAGTLYQHHD